jgi:coenzyme F420-reducing hydrogenase delta subunit
MHFLSSAEGIRFAEIATEMTDRARKLGPNPLKNGNAIEEPMEVEE